MGKQYGNKCRSCGATLWFHWTRACPVCNSPANYYSAEKEFHGWRSDGKSEIELPSGETFGWSADDGRTAYPPPSPSYSVPSSSMNQKTQEDKVARQAYEPTMPLSEPPQPSYTPPVSPFTIPDTNMNQQTWDEEEYEDEDEDTDEEEDYIEEPPVFVSSPAARASAPGHQEPEHYQPPAGQSRLGRDIQTGKYVDVPQASRRQGLYVIGATGTGKSGLIENLIIQDIKQGLGVGLLDPHGDLTDAVLSRLPDTRFVDGVKHVTEEDVILLDIKNTQYPFGLNLFSCPDPSDLVALTTASAHVMHIFRKLWGKGGVMVDDAWGVLLEKVLENATLTLLENPGYTMAEIPLLLDVDNPTFRKKLVQNLMSDAVRDFWEREFATLSARDQREEIQSTLTRVNSFLRQQLIRNIVGQSRTTIDFRSIMDERKILLVRLSVRLGEGITTLLGTMIIAGILDAAYSRADLPVNKRKQFNLYADEFQRFASEDFATLLTEARKYGIATTIAHQMRSQLDTQNRGATLNVANLVVFKISGADATEIAGEFDITPQEAWEQEIEPERIKVLRPQRHERIEEQVEVEVEDDILEVTHDPVDYLVTARGTHTSMRVREIAQNLLVTLAKENSSKKILVNNLLVAVMDGRIQVKTDKFIDFMQKIAISFANGKYIYAVDSYMLHFAKNRDFIRMLVLSPANQENVAWQVIDSAKKRDLIHRLIFSPVNQDDATQQFIEDEITKIIEKRHKEKLPKESNVSNMTRQEKLEYVGYDTYDSVAWDILEIRSFIVQITSLAEELAREPIRVPTGKKRMVKRIQPHITYLTHESEKITHPRIAITHPQRTYADMLNEVASQIANLPAFTARAKIAADGKPSEHTIRTLEPERGLGKTALQERIERIQTRNRDGGYTRLRQEAEAEIRTRQNQWREPPEPPPITRRHPK